MYINLLINKFISPSCKSLRVLEHAPITHHLPLLQERPKTIDTHQYLQESTSSMDFIQDSFKIQPFDPDFFSNFQYLFGFGPILQELVS